MLRGKRRVFYKVRVGEVPIVAARTAGGDRDGSSKPPLPALRIVVKAAAMENVSTAV
jgi:hypothetical protein